MAVSDEGVAFVQDVFVALGPVRVRKMFGGAGVYADDLMFAIWDDDSIWLKVDADNEPEFEARNLPRFLYQKSDGSAASMSYRAAPLEIYDDPDQAAHWGRVALEAARRAKAARPPRRRKNDV